MKTLRQIILVNWYLLDALQIDIEGNTAFIGPNAAGKSSMLDAVQAVLLGGDQRMIRLNASAGERSRRSLREYCLGVVRDGAGNDLDADLKPRENAVSYIVLGFRDEESGEETSVGMAMHAQLAGNIFEVDGRFITPRLPLLLRDFIHSDMSGDTPLPWDKVRENLRRRCKALGSEFRNFAEAERFVRELGESLGQAGRSFEPKRFARNLQNAVTFAPIRDVSQFVRRYILEDRPIRVRELQESLRRYRDIESKTREVHDRIEALKLVRNIYQEAARKLGHATQYDWIEKEAAVLRIDHERNRLEREQARQENERAEVEQRIHAIAELIEVERERISAIKVRIESSDVETRRKELISRSELQREKEQSATNQLEVARRTLTGIASLIDDEIALPQALRQALQDLSQLLPAGTELLSRIWPSESAPVRQAVDALLPYLEPACAECSEALDETKNTLRQTERELTRLRGELTQLEQGKSPLNSNTIALQALLRSHDIDSRPLCDVIDVADERWRDAVERYLGGLREALIVDPENAAEAIRLYRREGRGTDGRPLSGARIINTKKTSEWLNKSDQGSLAEIIVSEDRHARAYINRLMGKVIRVDTEGELMRHERAITDDGMLAANGALERMKPERSLIGRRAIETGKLALQQEFQRLTSDYETLKRRVSSEEALVKKLDRSMQKLHDLPDLAGLVNDRDAARQNQSTLTAELTALNTQDVDTLKRKQEELVRAIQARQREQIELDTTRIARISAIARTQTLVQETANAMRLAGDERTRRANMRGQDMAGAASQFERLLNEAEGDFAHVEEQARRRAAGNRHGRTELMQKSFQLLNEYALRYGALLPGSAGLEQDALHLEMER